MTRPTSKKSVSATVTMTVDVDPETAFDTFVGDIDLWWRRGPRFRPGGFDREGTMVLEARVGGRLLERYGEGDAFECGRVLEWEANRRILLEWRLSNFAPDESTEVEITFEPTSGGTRVVVCHRGMHDLRADHPARHGLDGFALSRAVGTHWSDLFRAFVDRARERR